MAQQKQAHVPKFGNWDNDGNVPYTVYFENARKGKGAGGKMINPNDPAENPEAFSVAAPSPNRSEGGSAAAPPRHERRPSDAPPLSPNPYAGSPYHRHAGGEPPRRGSGGGGGRTGGGYSVEQSPLHPYSHSSKADYSENGGYGLVANSVERSRAKGGSRGNETPTRGSAVPRFGDWDSNPASADGYTHIFNQVREEKQSQAGKPAAFDKDAARGNGAKQHDDGYASSKFSCFGWCK
ncbi:RPM1-interacting protein 4-like isoform X2 [Phragmites australis]|uniref:RPM1-interacting protein 4-like isoform X2 n=1 Tax=Phragmites australis TaxID=29695 RepID=UPI002D77AA9C|nr:RPM1-interacting protein 4-like isoform X2 [Phragmites australis]